MLKEALYHEALSKEVVSWKQNSGINMKLLFHKMVFTEVLDQMLSE
jgi:hypothetical protein